VGSGGPSPGKPTGPAPAAREPPGLLLEDFDEGVSDDPALALGVALAREPVQEAVLGARDDERDFQVLAEQRLHLLALALAQQAVVDEHAREAIGDRLVHERGRHRRSDAARDHATTRPLPY